MNCDDLMSHQKAINQEMSVELPVEELGTGRWTFRSPLNNMGTEIAQGYRQCFSREHTSMNVRVCMKGIKKQLLGIILKAQSTFEVQTFPKRQK